MHIYMYLYICMKSCTHDGKCRVTNVVVDVLGAREVVVEDGLIAGSAPARMGRTPGR